MKTPPFELTKALSNPAMTLKGFLAICLISMPAYLPAASYTASTQPLMDPSQLSYSGGFRVPGGTFGESDFSYPEGKITLGAGGRSLYMVGHAHQQAIAEISIPDVVDSTNVADFKYATVLQSFSRVLNRPATGNSQQIDRISGMEYYDGRLIVNAYEYYDGLSDATHTTLVVDDAANLGGSSVSGYFGYDGIVRAGGWISPIDSSWQDRLGGSHITGNSSGKPIITRLSVGPSAYAFNMDSDLLAAAPGATIPTTKLSSFDLANIMGDTKQEGAVILDNNTLSNDLWTHNSHAVFGFVVPGTRTYATFGSSAGHASGVGYKVTQDTGSVCAGYCPRIRNDVQNYYWLFDLNDLMQVKAGLMNSKDVVPYAYGELVVPNQRDGFTAMTEGVMGGSFDSATNTLYFSVYAGDILQSEYVQYPIVVAYKLSGVQEPQPEASPSKPPGNIVVQ